MTDVLKAIDDAIAANLCGCGCGQQIPDRGPSSDFVNEKHQQAWAERGYRASGGKIAGDWHTHLRRNGIRLHIDGGVCPIPETCREARPAPDETPMARVVRDTSSLRRAIDKILGKSR